MALSLALTAFSARLGAQTINDQELLRQQQRERAQEQNRQAAPDVRLTRPSGKAERLPEHETPCFVIKRIALAGEAAARFEWALAAADQAGDPALGRCLGSVGINQVMKRIQNAIVGAGYVTTRILAGEQDLSGGTLTLTLVPGRVRAIRAADPAARIRLGGIFPVTAGELLNLRDIEQALENLKRVPTAEADIQIVPSEGKDAGPGDSDLVVVWRQSRPLRFNLGLDDAGSKATGRNQGNATLSLDNPLALGDLFYVTYGQDIFNQHDRGTRSLALHYSLPVGYWLFAVNASDYTYRQTVAGLSQNIIYSGRSSNSDIRLSRIVHRDAVSKTTVAGRIWQRSSRNYIDDTEVEVQRRQTAGGELSLAQRRYLGSATLDASLAWRWGTGALGARPAPEETGDHTGTSRPRILSLDSQLNLPFKLGGQSLRYTGALRAQWNDTPLVPQDRFAIGGRYTVRGFDGELILTGERGWLMRNDLGLALGASGQEIYLGLDHGEVAGPTTGLLLGKRLTGAVLGLRGSVGPAGYDLFIGTPLAKPEGFRAPGTIAGFSLNLAF